MSWRQLLACATLAHIHRPATGRQTQALGYDDAAFSESIGTAMSNGIPNEEVSKGEAASETQLSRELRDRIQQLESKTELELIRRESRIVPALIGIAKYVRLSTIVHDEKGQAALHALFFRLFSPGTAAAAGGMLVLLLTALQVGLIWRQNSKLDQQTQMMQAQVNVALTAQIGSLLEDITEQTKNIPCLKPETVTMALEEGGWIAPCWVNIPRGNRQRWIHCYYMERPENKVMNSGPATSVEDFRERCLDRDGNLSPSVSNTMSLDDSIAARVVTLTRLARPYRFVDTEPTITPSAPQNVFPMEWIANMRLATDQAPKLVRHPLSPERGILFAHIVGAGFEVTETELLSDAEWDQAYAPGLNASRIDLPPIKNASFQHGKFDYSTPEGFEDSDLRCTDFHSANLLESEILRVDLAGANFDFARLPEIENFIATDLKFASFDGAYAPSEDWLEQLAKTGVPGFDKSMWRMNTTIEKGLPAHMAEHQISLVGKWELIEQSDFCERQ